MVEKSYGKGFWIWFAVAIQFNYIAVCWGLFNPTGVLPEEDQ